MKKNKTFLIYPFIIIILIFFSFYSTNQILFSKTKAKAETKNDTKKQNKIDSLEIAKFKADSIQIALIKEEKRLARAKRKNLIKKNKNVLLIGFNIVESNNRKKKGIKYDFIAKAYEKYLQENLINNGYIIDSDKSDELDQDTKQTNSLFLSSRNMFKNYKDYNFNSSIQGSFEIRGKIVKLNIEVFSNSKNKIIFKEQFEGRKSELLTFFHNVTQTIFNMLNYDIIPENIFPIEDNYIFYKYLTLLKLEEDEKFEKIYDILEDLDLSGKINDYPVLIKMFDFVKLKGINENQEGFYIGKLYEDNNFYGKEEKLTTKTQSQPKDTENFAKYIIKNGYKFILESDILNIDKSDSTRANLIVDFQVKFKKAYRSILLRKINKEKGDKRWRNMGRYYYSKDDNKKDSFVSVLKDQIFKFTIYDNDDKELFEEEITIDLIDFESGIYENLKKDQAFPLNPISPTIDGFRMANKTDAVFVFEDIDMDVIRKMSKSKIEILFE